MSGLDANPSSDAFAGTVGEGFRMSGLEWIAFLHETVVCEFDVVFD